MILVMKMGKVTGKNYW